jgi:hypothetical protein
MDLESKKVAQEIWDLWREHHDADAKEHRQCIRDIKEFLSKLQCGCHNERMIWMQRWIALGFAYTSALALWFQWIVQELKR